MAGNTATNTATLAATDTAYKGRTGHPTWGVATFAGTGAQTAFSIAHGQAGVPKPFSAIPLTEPATARRTVTATAANIVVTFAAAPANGASLKFRWSCSRL